MYTVAELASLSGDSIAPGDLPVDPRTVDNQSESGEEDSNEGRKQESDGRSHEGVEGAAAANNNKENPASLFADESCTGKNKYQYCWRLSWKQIADLEGEEVDYGAGLDKITWKVIKSVKNDVIGPDRECGVKLDFYFFKKSISRALLLLWPGDMWDQYNEMVRKVNGQFNPTKK